MGYEDAFNELGRLYYLGHGTEKKYDRAIHWFKKGGYTEYILLGFMHYYGHGFLRDYDEAFKLIEKASYFPLPYYNEEEVLEFMKIRSEMYLYGRGTRKDEELGKHLKKQYLEYKSALHSDKKD